MPGVQEPWPLDCASRYSSSQGPQVECLRPLKRTGKIIGNTLFIVSVNAVHVS